ncbi:MAG: ABC transporter permease subunit [Oscillospiraceae bacterium]|nr:ABC transporter permease subunit [Oscillospiraceae bacterium]
MFNWALYKREMKSGSTMLLIFIAVISLYVSIIITTFNPDANPFKEFEEMMPGIMEAVGMIQTDSSMLGYFAAILYGFILIIIPMVFSILSANKLIAKYVDNNSMASLLAAPIKRARLVITQIYALFTGIIIIVGYVTLLQIGIAEFCFPGELDINKLLILNLCLLILHFFIAGICFICSCIANSTSASIGWGAGIPSLMLILQMLGNVGDKADWVKYCTFFTLFNPQEIIAGTTSALLNIAILGISSAIIFFIAIQTFIAKDLNV